MAVFIITFVLALFIFAGWIALENAGYMIILPSASLVSIENALYILLGAIVIFCVILVCALVLRSQLHRRRTNRPEDT